LAEETSMLVRQTGLTSMSDQVNKISALEFSSAWLNKDQAFQQYNNFLTYNFILNNPQQ